MSVAFAEPSVVVAVVAAEPLTSAAEAAVQLGSVAVEEAYDSHNTMVNSHWLTWSCVAGHSYFHIPPA